jgi:hypothetical protein
VSHILAPVEYLKVNSNIVNMLISQNPKKAMIRNAYRCSQVTLILPHTKTLEFVY